MARPWRIEFPGAVYHVISRGNNRADVFLDDDDRRRFIDLLGRAALRFHLDIIAFCLMSNHCHLFLRTRQANLARAMQWLAGTYTQAFNRGHRRDGHLFKGRYRAVVVDDEAHWQHLSAYIHLNPVRAGFVEDPAAWVWSSFRDYVRTRPRFEWLEREAVLSALGGTETQQRRNYRREVLALAGKKESFWSEIRGAVFFGEESRWQELKEKHGPAGRRESVAGIRERPAGMVDFAEEVERVAAEFGVKAEDILSGRRRGRSRPAAYYHLVQHCGLTGTRVAELFQVSGAAVSLGIKEISSHLERDKELKKKLNALNLKLKL